MTLIFLASSDTIIEKMKKIKFKEEKYEKGSAKSLLRLFGALKGLDIDWKEKEKRMKEFRISFDKKIKETTEYMEKSRK